MEKRKVIFNKVKKDKNGNPLGILLLDKPAGITSHDLVDKIRDKLKTKKVGHAGTLDPFASGLLIMLIGKETKSSEEFLNLEKEYEFEVILGISTDTQDPEGKVLEITNVPNPNKSNIEKVLQSFTEDYYQYMPVYSSIKINGIRLRELAHASKEIKIEERNKKRFATFIFDQEGRNYKSRVRKRVSHKGSLTIEILKRRTEVKQISLLNTKVIDNENITFMKNVETDIAQFPILKIRATVSKGTYIRQLGEDIGKKLGNVPAMVYSLRRTRIGEFKIGEVVAIENLKSQIPQ